MKRALLISGGGSWGAYGGGTLARINGKYNTAVGVSTGSLLAPLAILNEWEILKDAYTSVNNNNIFDGFNPLTVNGKLKKIPIILALILGKRTVCTSNALRKTIDEFYLEKYFVELKNQNKEVIVGTQNYAQTPSKTHYFSSTNENFRDFKDWMWCSANFPFFSSLVKKSWKDYNGNFHVGLWSDGGLTDLAGLNQLMYKDYKEIDIILHRTKNCEKFEGNRINNLMDNITTSINAMRYDIEFEYFYQKIQELNADGTKVTIYWLPRKLSNNSMSFNQNEMLEWWNEGYETAFNEDRIQVFNSIGS